MLVKNVRFADFRNIKAFEFEPYKGINLFSGRNAQGKSNILEGLILLASGRSFRSVRDFEMIRRGSSCSRLEGVFSESNSDFSVKVFLNSSKAKKKVLMRNNKPIKRFSEFLKTTACIVFSRTDLNLVYGSPENRRVFLDKMLCVADEEYLFNLQNYFIVLKQKNALLKTYNCDISLIDTLNTQLASYASKIIFERINALRLLSLSTSAIYSLILPQDSGQGSVIELDYSSPFAGGGKGVADIESDLVRILSSKLQYECEKRVSLIGPHRDDIVIKFNSNLLKLYGSQGQQRTCAVALKLAEGDFLTSVKKIEPIIFMDDCFSEMDTFARKALWNYLSSGKQVFLTANDSPAECDFLNIHVVDGGIDKIVYQT